MEDESNLIDLDEVDGLLCTRLLAYLAGPLTALAPADELACRQIRNIAKRALAARFQIYDPADYTAPGTSHTPDDVFLEDHTHTSSADLVFFHVPSPSLGVGIESQIAAEATIPRVIARPKGRKISRMFEGVFNPTIADIEYDDPGDFEAKLLDVLPAIARAARTSSAKRRPILTHIQNGRCGEEMFKSRMLLRISMSALASATDIRECMLRRLERDSTVAATLTVVQLMRLAHELKTTLILSGKVPTLQGPSGEPHMPEVEKASLDSLYSYLRSRNAIWVPDDTVFAAWNYAFPQITEGKLQAARGNDPTAQGVPLKTTDWHQIFNALSTSQDDPQLFF